MSDGRLPPHSVLERAGLSPGDVGWVAGHPAVWLVSSADVSAVLRRYDLRPPLHGIPAVTVVCDSTVGDDVAHRLRRLTETVAWLHAFLAQLSERFPAPSPVALFAGQSWWTTHGEVWEALTFLPGDVVGWQASPSLRQVGAFLANYHTAVVDLVVPPRPVLTPLGALDSLVDWSQAPTTMGSVAGSRTLRALLDEFAGDLEQVGYPHALRGVIHGDATTHNIVADGNPPAPCGLIDFQLAYHEPLAADIAFGLWRSGRPVQDADHIDLDRVGDFVAGYHEVRPLTDAELAAIPVYLRGRGLQMLVKRTKLGLADLGPLPLIAWTRNHRADLERAASAAAR
jgi:Ser/Thr protein kinase RdoA (MazF antagonist)